MSTWTLSLFRPRYGTYPSDCSPQQTTYRVGASNRLILPWYSYLIKCRYHSNKLLTNKGGQSAIKFRKSKSQILKFAGLKIFGSFRKWHFAGLWFADPIFIVICRLKNSASPQIHTFSPHICKVRYFAEICLRFSDKSIKFADLRTGTPKKFADLRLRNEPENLRICDFRTFKKFACTPLQTDKDKRCALV
jgi:hypothetical protein